MSHNHFIQNKSKTPSRKTMGRAAVMVVAMVVTLIFCSVTAFAWFSANVANTGNTITTGNYQINVQIRNSSYPSFTYINPENFFLDPGEHTFLLTATGTVSTGYCKIQIGDDDVYYTQQLAPGESMTFTLNLDSKSLCNFTACWGTYSGTEDVIEDNGTIGNPVVGNSILNAAPAKPDNSTASEAPESNESEETVLPETETPSQPAVSQPVESEPVVSEPETSTESTVVSDSSEDTGSQDAEEGTVEEDTNEETVEQPEETEPVASVGE